MVNEWMLSSSDTRFEGRDIGPNPQSSDRIPLIAGDGFGECTNNDVLDIGYLERAIIPRDIFDLRSSGQGDVDIHNRSSPFDRYKEKDPFIATSQA